MATDDDFVRTFNKKLGRYIGSTAKNTPEAAYKVDPVGRKENLMRAIALGELLAEKSASREGGQQTDKVTYEPVMGNFNQPAVDTILENADFEAPSDNILSNIPWVGDKLTELPGAGIVDKAWDFAGDRAVKPLLDPASRALDIISRPAYGTFEAMRSGAESLQEDGLDLSFFNPSAIGHGSVATQLGDALRRDPQAVGEATVEAAKGASRGLAGKDKTGFGEVIEQTDPNAPMWAKRTAGFAGELGLDPLNYVGLGLLGKLDNARYTDDAYKAFAREQIDEVIKEKGLQDLFKKNVRVTGGVGADGKPLGARWGKGNTEAGDILDDVTFDTIDKSTLHVARTGRVLGSQISPISVASKAAESIRATKYASLDENLQTFLNYISGTSDLTVKQLDDLAKKNPDFKQLQDELLNLVNKERKNKFATVDEAIDDLLTREKFESLSSKTKQAANIVKQNFDEATEDLQNEIFNRLSKKIYNTPALRVGTTKHNIKGLDRIGRAYADFRGKHLQGDLSKAFSYARQFPDRTSLMNQRIRSIGVPRYEDFLRGGKNGLQESGKLPVRTMARQYTTEQRQELTQALLKDVRPDDPKMAEAFDYIKDEYAKMFKEEMDAGVRTSPRTARNYAYLYYRGKPSNIGEFRKITKKRVKDSGLLPQNQIDLAHKAGLKVEQDAFRNLALRKLKSNRDLTRSWFTEDLLDHYGVMANRLSDEAASARKLQRISSNIPEHIKKTMKEGDEWYLPYDIKEVYDKFDGLLTGGFSEETRDLLRMYDRVLRMWKGSATIPYPGFHIRNSMGDMFMSWLDGVRAQDYELINRLYRHDKNPNKISQLLVGDRNFSYQELKKMFKENASSGGFYSTDLGVDDYGPATRFRAADQKVRATGRKVGDAFRKGSENREDFFRFAHFVKAFREEYPQALKGTKSADNALLNAIEASTYRVNKHLFDYGALTKAERNVLKRAMPFYTYTRKVIPTLVEAMALNPAQLAKTNRLFFDDNRRKDPDFNDLLAPDHLREIGYAKLTGGEEPWAIGAQFLPTDVLRSNLFFDDSGTGERNLIAQMNPLVKMLYERAAGEKAFNQAPIESGPAYFTDALFPFIDPFKDLVGLGNKEGIEIGLSGRFGLGLPFSQIDKDRQLSSLYGIENEIEDELGKVNGELEEKGLRLYLSKRQDGATFRIRDLQTDEVLYETNDPTELVNRGRALARGR